MKNPATIADNIGDNVGNITGMSTDLYGTLTAALCTILVIEGTSVELIEFSGYYYPILIVAAGTMVFLFTSFISICIFSRICVRTALHI